MAAAEAGEAATTLHHPTHRAPLRAPNQTAHPDLRRAVAAADAAHGTDLQQQRLLDMLLGSIWVVGESGNGRHRGVLLALADRLLEASLVAAVGVEDLRLLVLGREARRLLQALRRAVRGMRVPDSEGRGDDENRVSFNRDIHETTSIALHHLQRSRFIRSRRHPRPLRHLFNPRPRLGVLTAQIPMLDKHAHHESQARGNSICDPDIA